MKNARPSQALAPDPLWFKDAVIYELHVRAFSDGDGDGIGDFKGLAEKMDYLSDLGVTAIWLLPFYPSPVRDGGYDIADYYGIHHDYGTIQDFKRFLHEAHSRGLRVITELVINHTSDQHPWFQRARTAPPGSRWRDFYVWSDTPDRYAETRVIFQDFEQSNWTWDPVAKAYFWHRFYHHQPDLNFDNPAVKKALLKVIDHWFQLGVDGLRLDAVPYLFEREGTNCENLPETHAFLRELRAYVDEHYEDKMLLAEANQWPEDSADYFGRGDECHMNFHFPLMPRLFMSISTEDRFPIVDIMRQTPKIPDNCQWAIFLRNHDELTLEMVTDEERDYMYRAYASDPQARVNLGIRRRLAPLLGSDRRKIELLNAMLLSLPGTPVLYYGDEIGMGDNIHLGDRDGVRTPMQWSTDRNGGFSRANPQQLYLPPIIDPQFHFSAVNVEIQKENPTSLWWWMRRMMAMRNRYRAFGRGTFEFLYPENPKVTAYIRKHDGESILVVCNLSRHPQPAALDLSEYEGRTPVELFGSARFEAIGDRPFTVTLGPYGFFWFLLEAPAVSAATGAARETALPTLALSGNGWSGAFKGQSLRVFESALPRFLQGSRWFGGKARAFNQVSVKDLIWLPGGDSRSKIVLLLVEVEYEEGEPETYLVPVTFGRSEAEEMLSEHPRAAICRIETAGSQSRGVLYDASFHPEFPARLLALFKRLRGVESGGGTLVPSRSTRCSPAMRSSIEELEPSLLEAEQSNTSINYGDRLILKLYRKLDRGENPELEIGRFLTSRASFPHTPALCGHLSYERRRLPPATLGVLHEYVRNQGDAWSYTQGVLGRYFEAIMTRGDFGDGPPEEYAGVKPLAGIRPQEPRRQVSDLVGPYVQSAALLGTRTGELHRALSACDDDEAFAPEDFSRLYQRGLYQSMRNLARRNTALLESRLGSLPEPAASLATRLLDLDNEVNERYRRLLERKIEAKRIRCHGDYHLGQVLYTGRDFVVIDFEGEPARSLGERQLKRSPFRDVAGMLRSFHYAAHFAAKKQRSEGLVKPAHAQAARAWAELWYGAVGAAFLRAYLEEVSEEKVLAVFAQDARVLLESYLLDKAFYELGYELNNRPDWVDIPLGGLLGLLETEP